METKKTARADLENERTTFLLLGFTVVLALFFIALEWSGEEGFFTDWGGELPILIENEYSYVEPPIAPPTASEIPPETPIPPAQIIVHDDYALTEEPPEVQPSDTAEVAPMLETLQTPEASAPVGAAAATAEVAMPDVMPQYPGGFTAMNRYLFEHLKYPASASSQAIEGQVWCSFIVGETGVLSDIKVERGAFLSLDQEAIRVLQSMPAWIPGAVRGRPARVKVYLPIVFKL
jgi:protein TonB